MLANLTPSIPEACLTMKPVHNMAAFLVSLATLPIITACDCSTDVPDTSRKYYLPYAAGAAHIVQQPSFGLNAHVNQYAVDFAMPEATPVLAARAGIVMNMVKDCSTTEPFEAGICHENYIEILHDDGAISRYLHLQFEGVCVDIGASVKRGDVIGRSGPRGLQPHLHFEVLASEGETGTGRFGPSSNRSMEVHFADVPGDGIAAFLCSYRSHNIVNVEHCE